LLGLPAQAGADIRPALRGFDLTAQLSIEYAYFFGQHHEMQQHVETHDEEDRRADPEKPFEGQVNIEKGQLDRALEEQFPVGDSPSCHYQVEQHKEIAKPERAADTGRVYHRVSNRLQVAGLSRERFGGVAFH